MSKNPVIQQVLESYKPIWALNHAGGLFEWDLETYMPVDAAKSRGFAQAQLALMRQQRVLNLTETVSKAEKLDGLSDYEKGVIRNIKRELKYFTKIPPGLVEELQRTTTEATVVWREARKKSDFALFEPYLEKIVQLKREEADKLGYEGHPYNALMDLFEEDLTIQDVDKVFSPLVSNLKRILGKVVSSRSFPSSHKLEDVAYNEEAMRNVNQEVLRILGMPDKTFRMDVSTHPFTAGMSLDDVRITTRYEGKSFRETIFSVIHECGHALYDLQVDHSLEYTPLAGGPSLGIHESQSRFWENFVGRSREFTNLLYPILKKNLTFISQYSEDDIYKYFNLVGPSLIRVAADEVTYNFHIIVRYEVEKKLIGGEAKVSEIPAIWDDMMEEYVGVRPKNLAEGVLQDVHWSGGLIGYFPTYSLGNVIAGMVTNRMKRDLNIQDVIKRGDMAPIKMWLRENIHKWGSIYSPKDLQKKVLGDVYNPEYLVKYLEEKYLA
jgi:carboxypeptidase Taq